ncbi:hypothetical protein Srot_2461 [Segniliparus rotundus DSM 44985]|uniref:DUF6545 domain-containing protein n=1 Tax=Segniliparus rotundus (strain ATCC BAA-972 / CDC 1076 / CIP 108378 / DSM 44985 / JCM 13578) TaxID=640132 RepID=D6ZBF0_SEGRD|nr:MAB_1171c family putative transporter [Segniliparus rotundus]ADG98902.1 hypothetical protein Srot_2461 [Segniliparus rotundus DSM 44985]
MISSIPSAVAWPVLAVFLLIVALRLAWRNTTQFDRYTNIMLCTMVAVQLLADPLFERFVADHAPIGSITVSQFALCLQSSTCAEFLGVTAVMMGRSPAAVRRRHTLHRVGGLAVGAMIFVAGTRARAAGARLEEPLGWDTVVVWALFWVFPVILSVQIFRLCAKDLPGARENARRVLVLLNLAVIAFIMSFVCLLAFVLAVLEEFGAAHTVEFRIETHSRNFFWVLLAVLVVMSWACVGDARERLGLDKRGRMRRQLLPLWAELTALFPETVLDPSLRPKKRRRVTDYELNRMVVEIRDSLKQLRQYTRRTPLTERMRFLEDCDGDKDAASTAQLASQLVLALEAKRAGGPKSPPDQRIEIPSTARSLEEETLELLELSQCLQKAHATKTTSPRNEDPAPTSRTASMA